MQRDFPVLETERLRLRRPEDTDAVAIERLAGDYAIAEMTLNIPHPYPEGAAVEWITGTHTGFETGTQVTFAVTRREDGEFIGAMGLIINRPHNKAEIGYWIGRPFWGQGYATEALRSVIHYGFETLGLNRIFATYFLHNPASGRVQIKAGMKPEGLLRQDVVKWGRPIDLGLNAILREDDPA